MHNLILKWTDFCIQMIDIIHLPISFWHLCTYVTHHSKVKIQTLNILLFVNRGLQWTVWSWMRLHSHRVNWKAINIVYLDILSRICEGPPFSKKWQRLKFYGFKRHILPISILHLIDKLCNKVQLRPASWLAGVADVRFSHRFHSRLEFQVGNWN